MSKKINSVTELIKKSSLDKTLKKQVEQEINKKSLSKFLFSLRCEHKLTQKQLAEAIVCSQSRISKIERSYDDEVTVKDLLDYGKALNFQLEIGYRSKSVKIVDLIKYHAFKIKNYLEQLAGFAKNDETLAQGILKFHKEALFNIVRFIVDSESKLNIKQKKSLVSKTEQVYTSPPLEKLDKIPLPNEKEESFV